jgi:hypothetical protein
VEGYYHAAGQNETEKIQKFKAVEMILKSYFKRAMLPENSTSIGPDQNPGTSNLTPTQNGKKGDAPCSTRFYFPWICPKRH